MDRLTNHIGTNVSFAFTHTYAVVKSKKISFFSLSIHKMLLIAEEEKTFLLKRGATDVLMMNEWPTK